MPLLDRLLSLLRLNLDAELDQPMQPFHRIVPNILLGSRPLPEQVDLLKNETVTHVVSCIAENQRSTVAFLADDFETLFLPLRDGMYEDIGAHFPAFFRFVDEAEGRVLVHCQVGVSRSATLVTAQVMRTKQLRFYEAYQHVRSRRAQVLPNVGFASRLQQLETSLFPSKREGPASLTRYLHEVCRVPEEIEVLEEVLDRHDFAAVAAMEHLFGEIPRVVQGVRR